MGKESLEKAQNQPSIVVYTTSWCGDCHALKRFLEGHGLAFEERDIEADQGAFFEMMAYTGGKKIVPTVKVNGVVLVNPRLKQIEALLV